VLDTAREYNHCQLEAKVVEVVAAFEDDLVGVDPDVAVAGEDVDMGT
jgi:hypothetical protein